VQEKVLRVVEYGSFERVGGSRSIQVDVRILGATNQNLKDLAQGQKFKQDLLDRLSFEVLMIPPLRQRGGDILLLANHFAARMSHELGRSQMPTLSPEAMSELMDYSWPGNVRELKNVVERAVYRSQEPVIKSVEFDPFAALDLSETAGRPPAKEIKPDPPQASFKEAVLGFERSLLQDALHKARFNQKRAAQDLGLTYHQLRGLLRKHGGLDNLLS
jgi:psp operon transcriptional activator